jgi:outer membrane protein assembly factor BamD
MGPRFKDKTGAAFARIVKEYPLSSLADDAKKKLVEMEQPVPEPDPVALARMKYEQENRTKAGMFSPVLGVLRKSPDTRLAAKSGSPAMTPMRPTIPASVPSPAAQEGVGTTDVTVSPVSDTSALDNNPDARQRQPTTGTGGEAAATTPATGQIETPAATPPSGKQQKQKKSNNKNKKSEPAAAKPK